MKRKEIKQLYEALKGLKLKDAPDNVMVPVYKNLMLLKPIVDEIETQNQLEVYAGDCAIITAQHIAAVNALTSDAEIEAYDYTVGYPAKLSYSL